MLAGICTHTRLHARTDPKEEKGPRSLEEEQTLSPGTAEMENDVPVPGDPLGQPWAGWTWVSLTCSP